MKLFQDPYDPNKHISTQDNFIVAEGGDGTLLRAIRDYHPLQKPFYPLAKGTKNFLMNPEDDRENSKPILLSLIKFESNSTKAVAFNEIAIGSFCGWIDFSVEEAKFPSFQGSALVIATTQGSTGLNLNNGGPVLPIDSNQWAVTSNQSATKVNTVVKPTPLTITAKARKPFQVLADGQLVLETTELTFTIELGPTVLVHYNNIQQLKEKRWNNL